MNIEQLRDLVVVPTLKYFDMWSEAAEQLLIGTIMQESHGEYIQQLGGGPALGIYQMEPATHDDIWCNYLEYRPQAQESLFSVMSCEAHDSAQIHGVPPADELISNLKYATLMCRLHYRRVPKPLPKGNDIKALAQYWKDHYNTIHGAGAVSEFIKNFPYEVYGLERGKYEDD